MGIRVNGAYWSSAQETIDALSGNVNISIPILTARSRTLSVPLYLTYNSQNWERTAAGAIIRHGNNLRVGFGWLLQFGCIVPGVSSGYTFIDGSGAEYPLTQVSDGWSSTQGLRATWVPATSQLHFWDGTTWTFGCTSAKGNVDAGYLYPTLIQDTNGNQIIVSYLLENTTGSIAIVEDARAQTLSNGSVSWRATYQFEYSWDQGFGALQYIISQIQTDEAPVFSYVSASVTDPWDSNQYATQQLSKVVTASGFTYWFAYNSDGTMAGVTFPHGATVNYGYTNFSYSDGRAVTEVSSRSTTVGYSAIGVTFTRPAGDASLLVHSGFTATESSASGVTSGQRRWSFITTSGSWQLGLTASYSEGNISATVRRQTTNSWAQRSDGTPYASIVAVTLDPGTKAAATTSVQTTVDQYGNALQITHYDYNSSTPLRTVTNTYLTATPYVKAFIRNRLLTSSVTAGGQTTALASYSYDSTPLTNVSGIYEHDSTNYGTSNTLRGNKTVCIVAGVNTKKTFDITGLPISATDSLGSTVAYAAASGSNNAAIGTVTPNNTSALAKQITYDSALRPLNVTGPNSATVQRTYDSVGRLSAVTSVDGSVATYSYSANPTVITVTKNGRWTSIIHDTFGRPSTIQRGTGSTVASQVDYWYGQSPNSPNGRLASRNLPYAPGGSPSLVNYTRDELGRLVTATNPSSGGTTTWSRSANSTTVTDSAGRWKTLTHSADGTLAAVQTPGAGIMPTFTTTYAYTGVAKLGGVSMSRPEGSQTRTFQYDTNGRPVMKKHVETGPKSFTYYADGNLQTVTDNIGQKTTYKYDANKRLTTVVSNYANGTNCPSTSRQYYYDTNPFNSSYTQNGEGRLTAVQWGSASTLPGQFTEMYTYNVAGRVLGKRVLLLRGSQKVQADISYAYDSEGRVTSISYPDGSTVLGYTYDALSRLSGITHGQTPLVQNVTYNAADRVLTLEHQVEASNTYVSETRTFTDWNQLSSLAVGPNSGASNPNMVPAMNLQLSYASDGKLNSQTNQTAGTGATYSYDSRGRVSTANSTGSGWGISEGFDGFGNRNAQNLTKGSAPQFSATFNAANNQMVGATYDANGNIVSFSGTTVTYQPNNMPVQITTGAGTEYYAYDTRNRRVWKKYANGNEELYVYGAGGKRLATFSITSPNGTLTLSATDINVHFGRRLIRSRGVSTVQTRLNHVKAWAANSGASSTDYLPYGEELNTTQQDREKFGSYVRDSATGIDYAHNRYYSSQLGRFLTPDPCDSSARLDEPDSWNRYSFVSNDPVNRVDPTGCDDNWDFDCVSGSYSDNCDSGGSGVTWDTPAPSDAPPPPDIQAPLPTIPDALAPLLQPPTLPAYQNMTEYIASCEGHNPDGGYGAYNDSLNNCTVRYGHLVHLGACTASDYATYQNWDQATAQTTLQADVQDATTWVTENTQGLTPPQTNAVIDLYFNMGQDRLMTHDVWRDISSGNLSEVPADIMSLRAGGGGIITRRQNEVDIWNGGPTPTTCYGGHP